MPIHYMKVLAKQSPHGDLDLLLAKHYLASHQWSLALRHVENSIKKGNRFDSGIVNPIKRELSLRLGRKYLNLT